VQKLGHNDQLIGPFLYDWFPTFRARFFWFLLRLCSVCRHSDFDCSL